MKLRGPAVFLFFLLSTLLFAQYVPGEDWKSLDQPLYFWIYPDFLNETVGELSLWTEERSEMIAFGLTSVQSRQYPLILYPWSMIPNGYVTPYNHHSLWYTADPGTEIGAIPWLEELAIHEGRHVAQMNALMQSTGRVLYLAGGDVLHSLTLAMSPSWLLEGDAVFMETALSESGRGRMGSFQNNFRLLMLEEDHYQYDQFRFPSRKRLPTNAYDFGYFFTSWLKQQEGLQAFDNLFLYQAQLPLPVLGTTRSIRKATGDPLRINFQLFRESMGEMFTPAPAWGEEILWLTDRGDPWKALDYLTEGPSGPVYIENTPQKGFLLNREGKNSFPLRPLKRLSGADGVLLWDQIRYGDRYLNQSESEIWILGEKGKKMLLKGRYYDPAFSPLADRMVVLERSLQGDIYLVISDLEGSIEKRIPLPGVDSASWPVWDLKDSLILAVKTDQGVELVRIFLEDGRFESLTPSLSRPLIRPFQTSEGIAFIVDNENRKELYRLNQGSLQKLKSGGYGILSSYEDYEGRLYLISRESSAGDRLAVIENPQWEDRPWSEITSVAGGYFQKIPLELPPPLEKLPVTAEEEDYGPDYFHPYGWGPYTLLNDLPEELFIPFSLMSQDPLNSNFWELTYYYQIQEKRNTLRFAGQSNLLYTPIQLILSQDIPDGRQPYYDSRASVFLDLPLGIHRGLRHFSTELRSGMTLLYRDQGNKGQHIWYSENYFTMKNWQTGAPRDIGSPWEQTFQAYGVIRPEKPSDYLAGTSLGVSFPGPFNQKLEVQAFFESNSFNLTSRIPAPRGWDYKIFDESRKFEALYHIPLFYPEAALGRLAYFSRVRMELFAENLQGDGEYRSSLGGELILDFYPLQIPVEIYTGLRYSYLLEEKRSKISWVLFGAGF